jgi:parallel beta-helix repeat protein
MNKSNNAKNCSNLSGWSKFMKRNLIFCLSITVLLTTFASAAVLHVPSAKYDTIEAAIQQANNGDTIIIASGRYEGIGFYVNKNLTITGAYPNDPNRTVIDCNGRGDNGFYIRGNGGTCELKGLTITNVNTHSLNGLDGDDPGEFGFPGGWNVGGAIWLDGNHKVTNCIIRNISIQGGDGGDGDNGDSNEPTRTGGSGGYGGDAAGAGVFITGGRNVIKNTLIEDCIAIGGDGGDGGNGNSDDANYINSGRGGNGGVAGGAFGAGICVTNIGAYLDPYGNFHAGGPTPIVTVENCTIRNCRATGGNGGDGGDGGVGNGDSGGYGGLTYYDPNQDAPINHSAMGGGIYVGLDCSATFTNCTVSNSSTAGSISGIGGRNWGGDGHQQQPMQNTHIASFGGGIYCGDVNSIIFSNCDIQDNNTTYYYDEYVGYGGGLCFVDANSVTFTNCDITGNSAPAGGGFYGGWLDSLQISGNNFLDNSSYIGGGLLINDINIADIFNTVISGNSAKFISDGFYGSGGGIYASTSGTRMFDCQITDNTASGSGGGIYIDADINTLLFDCLIAGNSAGGDGGGVSATWWADLNINNCTIANNTVEDGFGGGVSCTLEASIGIINSIIWNNSAQYGQSLALGSPYSAAGDDIVDAVVNYSDLQNGQASVFVASGSYLYWNTMGNPNSNLLGTSLDSPLFVEGYWGSYYLSQPTGQTTTSPCVDAGFGLAYDNNLFRHTTRTDHTTKFGLAIDDGNTDMGYHYLLNTDLPGDLNYDGQVDINDLAVLLNDWLSTGCTFPYFCHGCDLTEDGKVNFEDFALFAEYWNEEETTPPTPDPMTWKILPRSAGLNSVSMTATTAKDYSGSTVEYRFRRSDSNGITTYLVPEWRTEPNVTDTGLVTKRVYGYQVQARDARGNETGWSVIGYAVPGEDWTPPTPNPMTWAITPYPTSPNSIAMTATTAIDPCGVEYYFYELSGNPGGDDSDWQDSPFYEDLGLDPCTPYTYQVKARDKSLNRNETEPSVSVTVKTPAVGQEPNIPTIDTTPPVYTPTINGLWFVTPYAYSNDGGNTWYHTMTAVAATDANSPPVWYRFECNGSGNGSGWFVPADTGQPVVFPTPPYLYPYTTENRCQYRVHIKDNVGNELTSSWWDTLYGLVQ